MSRNDDYTTGNLLDLSYRQNYYKLIGIDLSRQINTSIPQQIILRREIVYETHFRNFREFLPHWQD